MDLTLITPRKLGFDDLRATYSGLNLELKQKSGGVIDWVEWRRPTGEPIILSLNVHHGLGNLFWTVIGFDGREFRKSSEIKLCQALLNDFLDLGRGLWSMFEFQEGLVASEEVGYLFSITAGRKMVPEYLASNYANFLDQKTAESFGIRESVPRSHPKSSIETIGRNGLLVKWDTSETGLARLLEEEFGITL